MKKICLNVIFVISMIFTIIFSLFTFLNVLFNIDYVFDIKSIYYGKSTEYSKSMPLWLFNGIDVDEKGNIYIGNNMGVSVYAENGKSIGNFYSCYSKDFVAFKIIADKISFISKYNFDKAADSDEFNTYEARFDLDELSQISPEDVIISDELLGHKKSFSDYKNDNGYSISNKIEKNGKKYTYNFYGKVVVSDNNGEKIINLENSMYPIPTRFPATFALLFLIVSVFSGLLSYKNKHS